MLLLANGVGKPGAAKAAELLKAGGDGMRAVVEGIKIVEEDLSVHSVGQSSLPNLLGELQLDAAVMDGDTRKSGAVGALKGFKHPVEVAYEVMRRLDHEMLVGEGAERFAREIGAEPNRNETEYTLQEWKKHLAGILTEEQKLHFPDIRLIDIRSVSRDPEKHFGTTVFLCIDRSGTIFSGVSTSGWAWKYPGRLGDSPIVGAGSYADSRYGACGCTGAGEMTIRAGTARSVVLYLKMGRALKDAVREAAEDLAELESGLIDEVIIHAINPRGEYFALGVGSPKPRQYWIWNELMPAPEVREAEVLPAG